MFTSDAEAGDAEMLLIPPNRSERMSLAHFTYAPNFDEHFNTAIMLLSADTSARLQRSIAEKEAEAGMSLRDAERGRELAERWSPSLRKLSSAFATRMVEQALSPGAKGFFFAAVAGR